MEDTSKYPKIIYKYRSWTNEFHKDVLINNKLFMASPKDCNDPFDCRIPTNYFLLDSSEKIDRYAQSFIDRHKDFFIARGLDLANEKNLLIKDLVQDLDSVQKKHEHDLYISQDNHHGILSLSARWNSILMWSHYVDFHKGYCVGFWEEKMRNSGLFGKGGPVTYNPENNYPIISPLDMDKNTIEKGFKETHTKLNEWEYEKEYRLFNLLFPALPKIETRTIPFPDNFFAEIVIGLSTSEQHKKEIIYHAQEKGIKIYQAKKVPFKFEITREEIV